MKLENWSHCLDRLPLSPSEQETVHRFGEQANGRLFLPVAEILLKYGMQDDAIQLLLYGIQIHPAYSLARVVLVSELLKQGMPEEAWQILENSPTNLRDNKTAQILKFKLALTLGYEDLMPVLRQDMSKRDQFDPETSRLAEQLEREDFSSVRQTYIGELRAQGISLAQDFVDLAKQLSSEASSPSSQPADEAADTLDNSLTTNRRIDGFFVTPIQQIFTKPIPAMSGLAKKDMDALTLAHVYRRQGQYQKAIEILKRLLYLAPSNDMLRKQLAELRSLQEEQLRREREIDPELAERMELVGALDQKIRSLANLLEELDQYDTKKAL